MLRNPEKSNLTDVGYRLAGHDLSQIQVRGVWSLSPLAKQKKQVFLRVVLKEVREADKADSKEVELAWGDLPEENQTWREKLHHILTKEIKPDAFER